MNNYKWGNLWIKVSVGASMDKWTQIALKYTKIIIFFVKGLKVVARCCLNWIFLILILTIILY